MADIRYIITVDDKGTPVVKKFEGEVGKLAETTSKRATPAFAGLWKQIAVGVISVAAVSKAFRAMKDFMGDSVKAAAAQELAERNLADALSVTGRNVDALMPRFKNFANAIQDQTIYTDDAALSAMSLMAQLTDLDAEGLQQATRGAAGLASVFKVDLQSAATLVAKGLAGNVGALSRYGIQVDKNLSMEEKRVEILRQLSLMYERAKGETNTFAGALTQLKNQWGEVQETVGNAIVKNQAFRDAIKDLTEKVRNLAQSEDFKLWLSIIIDGLMKAVEWVGKFAKGCKDLMDWLANVKGKNDEFAASQKTLIEHLQAAAEKGVPSAIKALERMKIIDEATARQTGELGKAVEGAGNKTGDFGNSIKTTVTIIDTALPKMTAMRYAMLNYAETITETAIPAARDLGRAWADISGEMPEETRTATEKTKNYFDGLYNDIAQGFANTIESWLSGARTVKDFMLSLWNDIKSAFFRMVGEMVAETVVDSFKNFFMGIAKHAKTGSEAITNTLGKSIEGIGAGIEALLTGLGRGIAGMAKAIAGAAKEILIAAGVALAIYAGFSIVKGILGKVFGTGGGGDKATDWIHEIRDKAFEIQQDLHWSLLNLDDIKRYFWEKMPPVLGFLKAIAENTAILQKVQFGQHGLDTMVNRPTMFVAGERGPERVTVMPRGGNQGMVPEQITVPIYIGGEKIEERIIRIVNRSIGLKKIRTYA